MEKQGEEKQLQVRMLGEFSLSVDGHSISDSDNRSRKLWSMLAYILHHRQREMNSAELMELLWDDEDSSVNPANALKTVLHRVRSLLDRLECLSGQELILRQPGGFAWNDRFPCVVDTDCFEALYLQGQQTQSREKRVCCWLEAAELYRGDFLPKLMGDHWTVPVAEHYRQLFIETLHGLLPLLMEDAAYEQALALCGRGLEFDPYDENLYYYQIKTLVEMGDQRGALSRYESMNDLFHSKFGVNPSECLQSLYRQVAKTTQEMETDMGLIQEQLRESSVRSGAFFCEYEFFKDAYRIESRSAARNGAVVYLGLLSATDETGEQLTRRKLSGCMEKLKAVIQASLRKEDIFSQYGPSQYIIMLPCVNSENSHKIMERIIKRFNRESPHSTAALHYSVGCLDLDEKKEEE